MNSDINDKELNALGADEQMRTMRAELNALKKGLREQKITTEMMLRSAISTANRAVLLAHAISGGSRGPTLS